MHGLAVLSLVAACGVNADPPPAPLPPLPTPVAVSTDRFRDAEACGQCHLVADDSAVLHDDTGANISPVLLWRASMMGLAARDPFYLSVFAEELARDPDRRAATEALCSRCHAPAGSEELAIDGKHLTFDELTHGNSPAAVLGRGGVTCSLCHQIDPGNLDDERSFSGQFTVGYERMIFGPYRDPTTMPMELIVSYRPTHGAHIDSAELCATCHTVIVPGPYGDVVEQATYLEWRSSRYAADQPCQTCHVPTTDDAGRAITTVVAGFPEGLRLRAPVGRHTFVGGNAYMLNVMADAVDWLGAGVSAGELRASAQRSVEHLGGAAKVAVTRASPETFTVQVQNLTGHKLPTGYPSRRMWLHVTVALGGATIFESGHVDDLGQIVDATGTPLPRQPHRDEIAAADEVQIWEARLVDGDGEPTHRALDARRYGKDDRILPEGFAPAPIDVARLEPVAVVADPTFLPGSDTVTYRVPGLASGATVIVELLYQTLAPETVDAIAATTTPASVKFVELVRARPPAPVVMMRSSTTL